MTSWVFNELLNQKVTVEGFGVKVQGQLLHVSEPNKPGHIPQLLIIGNESGKHLIRNWHTIKTGQQICFQHYSFSELQPLKVKK